MSRKLQGEGEVTRLKEAWAGLSEDQRDYWRSQFASSLKQPDIRAAIKQKLGPNLLHDSQLTRFRDWVDEQLQDDMEAARQQDDARRIDSEHPHWTKDQKREALLDKIYNRSLASGDFKLGLAAMKQDKGFMEAFLARETFMRDLDSILEKLLLKAAELNQSNLSNAEKIKAMRQTFFADVEALAASGAVKIPKA